MQFFPDQAQADALATLCRKYQVRRLELFGSGANGRFDPDESDLDFLVEFDKTGGIDIVDQFFGLHESLEKLFGRKVDLVEEKVIKNPYFRQGVNRARRLLYAA
jgi:uncharacterized protein